MIDIENMKVLLRNGYGSPTFLIKYETDNCGKRFLFTVYEVLEWLMGGEPSNIDHYVGGVIEMDGDICLWFGDEYDGHLYMTNGGQGLDTHCKIMKELYKLAESVLF